MELWGAVRGQLVSLQWGASIAEFGGQGYRGVRLTTKGLNPKMWVQTQSCCLVLPQPRASAAQMPMDKRLL